MAVVVTYAKALNGPYPGTTWRDYAEWGSKVDLNKTIPVVFTAVVKNGSTASVDPSSTEITVVAGDTELQAECFEGGDNGVSCGTNLNSLRPDRQVRMTWGYFIPKNLAGDVTVEVSPPTSDDADSTFGEDVQFEGSVK